MTPVDGADPDRLRLAGWLARRLWFLEDELAALPALVPADGTVIDVGVNRGTYAVTCALLTGPGGRVIGLEPQPGPLRTARGAVAALRLDHVELHQLAASDAAGELSLIVPTRFGLPVYGRAFLADAPHLSSGDLAEFHSRRERTVEVTTLDALVERLRVGRVDLVKADVEGAELRVLRGAGRMIDQHRPAFLLEVEDRHARKFGHDGDAVLAFLTRRGYTPHVWRDGAAVRVRRVDPAWRNYLLLPG